LLGWCGVGFPKSTRLENSESCSLNLPLLNMLIS
jgi:hypothetical protein